MASTCQISRHPDIWQSSSSLGSLELVDVYWRKRRCGTIDVLSPWSVVEFFRDVAPVSCNHSRSTDEFCIRGPSCLVKQTSGDTLPTIDCRSPVAKVLRNDYGYTNLHDKVFAGRGLQDWGTGLSKWPGKWVHCPDFNIHRFQLVNDGSRLNLVPGSFSCKLTLRCFCKQKSLGPFSFVALVSRQPSDSLGLYTVHPCRSMMRSILQINSQESCLS